MVLCGDVALNYAEADGTKSMFSFGLEVAASGK